VFVVGCLGDWERAAQVLFERESVQRDSSSRRTTGQSASADAEGCAGTVSSKWAKGTGGPADDECYNLTTQPIGYRWQNNRDGLQQDDAVAAMRASAGSSGFHEMNHPVVAQAMTVRRLTPIECEFLQGFPRNYTLIPWRKKQAEDCPDGPRYKALGNSMAVNCMAWIGERIAALENNR
jgi:DNA (cytosine-5)-methyltransferase 1